MTRGKDNGSTCAMRKRDQVLQVRCSGEEIAMVRRLADRSGLSVSDVTRQLIRKAHAEREAHEQLRPKGAK